MGLRSFRPVSWAGQPLRGKCIPSACGISPYGKATHDDLSVPLLLRYGCHRLTTICASLRSFKLCSLVQLMFAAVTPVPLPPQRGSKVSACGGAAVVFHKAALPQFVRRHHHSSFLIPNSSFFPCPVRSHVRSTNHSVIYESLINLHVSCVCRVRQLS